MTAATAQGIQFLTLAYFGRPADPASLSAWPASGLSLEAIVLQYVNTAEYRANTVDPNSALNASGGRTFNDTNLINTFYQRLFGRLATSSEVAGWSDALARGAVNYDYLGITILQAGLNLPAGTEMRQVLLAKFDSAQLYTGILYNNPASAAAYSTSAAIQDGIAYNLSTTTPTPQTFAQAQAAVAQMVADSGAGGGQTFTLTTNIDTITAPATGIDTVNGVIADGTANGQTYQTGDTINGNGNTILNLVVNTAGATVAPIADVNNVAVVNINLASSTAANDGTLNMAEFDSVGRVAITQGTNAQVLTFSGAQFSTAYSINIARSVELFFDDFEDDTGAADTFSLAVNNAGREAGDAIVDLGGNGVEIVNVAATGTNFLFIDDGSAVETYAITGNGTNDIQINDGAADLTIDASTSTGTNIIGLDDGEFSSADTVLGGTGTDTFNAFLEAGTTAATITNVETVGLVADTANSFFSGINTTGTTTVNLLDGSDESVTLTAIKAEVTTIQISGSFGATADDLTVNYVNGANSGVTLLVDPGIDTVQGDVTFTRNSGALTLSVVGDGDAGDESSFEDLTANNISSFTLAAEDQDFEINNITANAATSFAFAATGGVTIDANGAGADAELELNTGNVEVVIDSISLSATGVDGDDNGSAIDLQINAGGNADDETTITSLILTSDATGAINLTIDEATADAVLIGDIDASASAGDLTLDLSDLGTENGVTVTLGSGDSTVTLTQGDDQVTGGSGDSTITTVNGADTIIGGSGTETVVMSTADDGIILSSFSAGANGDIASFDLSAWALPLAADGTAISAGDAAALDNATSGAAWVFNTGNVLVLSGIIADDNALVTELETNGAVVAGDLIDGDFILVAYYDGFSTQLRSVELDVIAVADIANAIVTGGGTSIEGVNTTALANGNFGFVA